jgi:hypothetical protein
MADAANRIMSKHEPAREGAEAGGIHDPRGGASPRRHHPRTDDGRAFLPDPHGDDRGVNAGADDIPSDFAEELGESFVTAATGNVDVTEQVQDRVDMSETGGPYVVVDGAQELALDTDAANPADASREPFPSPMRGKSD